MVQPGVIECSQYTMADVICVTGDVRLVGGSNPLEGRLEVCFFNQWGTICSGSWGQDEAGVICGQLGYSRIGTENTIILSIAMSPLCMYTCVTEQEVLSHDDCRIMSLCV